LPPGWLGKVHALHLGVQAASGEWLLFTDADVHCRPECLERAVALAVAERLDHLTLWFRLLARSVALRAALLSFGVSLVAMTRPLRVGRPGSKAFFGIGAFNLVRRDALERTPGLAWLRMELADDMAVSRLVVEHGGRSGWRHAHELLELEWYPSLPAMIRGLEKNSYGIFSRFSPLLFAVKLLLALGVSAAPVVALFAGGGCAVIGALALFACFSTYAVASRFMGFGAAEALAGPLLGPPAIFVALLGSALATWRQGGIRWRGTLYPVAELRSGQVVRL
jgi:hypothetical protein